MKLNEFAARATGFYQSGICVYLRSSPGRGKTTVIVESVPTISKNLDKNLGIVVVSGPLLTPSDAVGYLIPKPVTDAHGKTHMESEFTEPFWFRTAEGKHISEYDGGIIFVDEADKADTDVKKILGEAALSKRLGPHILPPGWVVWMAGNNVKDRSGSTKELDHLINRRMEINVTDDLESWEAWCFKHGVDPVFITFGNQNPQIVFAEGVPEKQGPWCTPRSLCMLAETLEPFRGANGDLPVGPDAVEMASGIIGEAGSAQLFAMIRLGLEMPKIEDIIKDPVKTKLPSKPDAQMLVCYNLAARVNDKNCAPVIEYMQRMPAEFSITFAKTACRREPTLIFTPAFEKWANKNSSLMAQLVDSKN